MNKYVKPTRQEESAHTGNSVNFAVSCVVFLLFGKVAILLPNCPSFLPLPLSLSLSTHLSLSLSLYPSLSLCLSLSLSLSLSISLCVFFPLGPRRTLATKRTRTFQRFSDFNSCYCSCCHRY